MLIQEDARSGIAGPAGAEARSAWRRSVRVPRPRRLAGEADMARRDRHVALSQTAGKGALRVAVGEGWHRVADRLAAGLPARRHRLANPPIQLAPAERGIGHFPLQPGGIL